ncbi:MAG TPA: HAD-IIIC family phosphatase [Acidobacteriaceae bacterium]|nr:HAD-IIIC family phosphatase [Acidobacteriaceae bacterium]
MSEAERQELRGRIKAAAAEQQPAVLLAEMKQLIRGSAKAAPDAMFCASALEKISDTLVAQKNVRRVKTFIVRSVTLEPLLPFLRVEAALTGLLLDVEMGGYGSYVDDMLNAQGALTRFAPELVLVVLELEDVAGALPELCANGGGEAVEQEIEAAAERMGQMLRGLRARSSARMVVQGFVVPDSSSLGDVGDANVRDSLPRAVERLNERVAALCRSIADCVFFDVDRLAARYGRRQWRDVRMFLSSRLSIAADAFSVYARGMARSSSALFRAPRKVLCTDLDNTLWGGVLGEEGPEGIATGGAFPGNCYLEYQRYLKQLASRGILLAAVSKNNESDVIEAFEMRAADLALSLSDFVAKKISWRDKAESLRELAAELSLGLDSFVFVDDNPVECEAIRRALPEVAVIGAPLDEPWRLLEMLAEEPFFDAVVVTEDDVNRTQEYRAQAQRAELATSAATREEFLASLGIVCTFLPVAEAPLARAVQLLAKTNQFNLTTRRQSAAEVERFASADGGQAIAVRVRDRFGDAGVVGLALAETKGDTCFIDSLLLSCRVIGRGIESALLAEIMQRARRMGSRRVVGEYAPTRKNGLCANFFAEHGFVRSGAENSSKDEPVCYEFDLRAGAVESPAWLTLEGTEEYEFAEGTHVTS